MSNNAEVENQNIINNIAKDISNNFDLGPSLKKSKVEKEKHLESSYFECTGNQNSEVGIESDEVEKPDEESPDLSKNNSKKVESASNLATTSSNTLGNNCSSYSHLNNNSSADSVELDDFFTETSLRKRSNSNEKNLEFSIETSVSPQTRERLLSVSVLVKDFEISSLKNSLGASTIESGTMKFLLELRHKDYFLQSLMRDIKITIIKYDKRIKALSEGLSATTRDGRNCRASSLKNSSNFSLSSRQTLKTPHLCHISSIQFFEAKTYGKFKHVQSFPQNVQLYSGNLRIFANANMTVQKISNFLQERREKMKFLDQLKSLSADVSQELKHNLSQLELLKKCIAKNRGGNEKYIGIKNRYFNSLKLMNPVSKLTSPASTSPHLRAETYSESLSRLDSSSESILLLDGVSNKPSRAEEEVSLLRSRFLSISS